MRGNVAATRICRLAIGCLVAGLVVSGVLIWLYPDWGIGWARLWLMISLGSFVCAGTYEAVMLVSERKGVGGE